MTVLLYIEELSATVEFDVTTEYDKGQRQTLECEPIPAGWEVTDIEWDRSLYSTVENEIISMYFGEVETEFFKQQK
ncbi:MAG: hypothetical protein V4560_14950 [Bacteroidota bacterium]